MSSVVVGIIGFPSFHITSCWSQVVPILVTTSDKNVFYFKIQFRNQTFLSKGQPNAMQYCTTLYLSRRRLIILATLYSYFFWLRTFSIHHLSQCWGPKTNIFYSESFTKYRRRLSKDLWTILPITLKKK